MIVRYCRWIASSLSALFDDNRPYVLAVEGEHPIPARTVIIRSEPDVRSDRL